MFLAIGLTSFTNFWPNVPTADAFISKQPSGTITVRKFSFPVTEENMSCIKQDEIYTKKKLEETKNLLTPLGSLKNNNTTLQLFSPTQK